MSIIDAIMGLGNAVSDPYGYRDTEPVSGEPPPGAPPGGARGDVRFGVSGPASNLSTSAFGDVGNTGTKIINTDTSSGGIPGLLGFREDYPLIMTDVRQDPNYASNRQTLGSMLAGAAERDDASNPYRQQQLGLMQMLQSAADGTGGPSAAESMLRQATGRNMSGALALALGARGGNQLGALKQAQMQRALISQDANLQAAQLRAQEQQAARGLLGQVSAMGREGDLQSLAQRDQLVNQLLAMQLGLDQTNFMSGVQQAQHNQGSLTQQIGGAHGVSLQNAAQGMQIGGATLSALGTLGAAAISDERLKEDIEPGEAKLGELLGAAGAHDYRYKKEVRDVGGDDRYVSPMAQELEQTEIGRSMVKETADGKIVDYGKGLGAMLSGLGWLHRRMEQLEGKSEKKKPLGALLAGDE